MDEQLAYVISFFSDLMNVDERRVLRHLLSARPLTDAEQSLSNAIAWAEARGNVMPEGIKSFMAQRRSGLSDDPRILELARVGLEGFYERTARRILAEDRDNIFLNNCPSCGALARTPKARQCRHCGHDWHGDPATPQGA